MNLIALFEPLITRYLQRYIAWRDPDDVDRDAILPVPRKMTMKMDILSGKIGIWYLQRCWVHATMQ